MCGILGFAGPPDRELLGRMAAAIVHRGPDDAGYLEREAVSLGHRRLSIIDRAGGHQPIANEDETVWLVYNGEVYNYRELRVELEGAGHIFRTSCDSEVIVHAYEEWGAGLRGALQRDVGVRRRRLPRGRRQARPEPRPLRHQAALLRPLAGKRQTAVRRVRSRRSCRTPSCRPVPDEQMVFEYLQHGFHDHRAETFFRGVYHVPAATWIEIPLGGAGEVGAASSAATATTTAPGILTRPLTSAEYWSPELRTDASADPADFRRRFRDSVERRLVSEVPVGSCLSGGLDSTTIVSYMSELLKEDAPDAASLRGQLKTFSAVFDGDPIDEREYIEIAVESTGADTTYTNPTSPEFVDELRDFIWHQEEPIVSTGPTRSGA